MWVPIPGIEPGTIGTVWHALGLHPLILDRKGCSMENHAHLLSGILW